MSDKYIDLAENWLQDAPQVSNNIIMATIALLLVSIARSLRRLAEAQGIIG